MWRFTHFFCPNTVSCILEDIGHTCNFFNFSLNLVVQQATTRKKCDPKAISELEGIMKMCDASK